MLIPHTELQAEQPALYTSLTSNLSAEEQQIVQSVVQQAETIAQQNAADALAGQNA